MFQIFQFAGIFNQSIFLPPTHLDFSQSSFPYPWNPAPLPITMPSRLLQRPGVSGPTSWLNGEPNIPLRPRLPLTGSFMRNLQHHSLTDSLCFCLRQKFFCSPGFHIPWHSAVATCAWWWLPGGILLYVSHLLYLKAMMHHTAFSSLPSAYRITPNSVSLESCEGS